MTPYCAIHVFPLTHSRRMTFIGRTRVTRSAAICDFFLLSGGVFHIVPKPGKLCSSAIQLSVYSTPVRLLNICVSE